MKLNHLLYMAGLLTTMAACTSDDVTQQQLDGDRTPVSLSYVTQPQVETRAAAAATLNDDNIESGQNVTVRISNVNEGQYTDYTYTTGDAGMLNLPNPAPYYPIDGTTHLDILAYTPGDASTPFTIRTDQSSDEDYIASDLLWATPVTDQARTTGNVQLSFSHKMAKIKVVATAGTAVSQINSIRLLNVLPTVTFNKTSGVIGAASGDATEVIMAKEETAATVTAVAVIPEQTYENKSLLAIDVTLNDNTTTGTAYYKITDSKLFDDGNVYTLNITVSYPEVNTTTEITGWTSGGTAYANSFFSIADITTPYTYDGNAKTPTLAVSHNGTELTENTDYTVSYVDNINAGTAAAIVTGINKYAGATGAKTFAISKAAGSISYATTAVARTFEGGRFTNPLTLTGDGTVTYASSNTAVATVNSLTGEVRIVGIGTPTITATVEDGQNYTYATKTATYALTTSVSFEGISVGNIIYQSGVWSPTYDAALGTPVAIVFTNYTTEYDQDLGWTHGYAMALKRYNSGASISNWCSDVSSLRNTQVTDALIPCTIDNVRKDLDGLKHCLTAKKYCEDNSIAWSNLTAIYAAMVGYESEVHAPSNSSGWYLPSMGQYYEQLRTVLPTTFTGYETFWHLESGGTHITSGINGSVITAAYTTWMSTRGLTDFSSWSVAGTDREITSSERSADHIYSLTLGTNSHIDSADADNEKSTAVNRLRPVFAF